MRAKHGPLRVATVHKPAYPYRDTPGPAEIFTSSADTAHTSISPSEKPVLH